MAHIKKKISKKKKKTICLTGESNGYLFIWLPQVLAEAHGILCLCCSMWDV